MLGFWETIDLPDCFGSVISNTSVVTIFDADDADIDDDDLIGCNSLPFNISGVIDFNDGSWEIFFAKDGAVIANVGIVCGRTGAL